MTQDDEGKPKDPPPPGGPHDPQGTTSNTDPPTRTSHLSSRMLENAAREQLSGPFGKLGRYVLKQHWGMTISDWEEKPQETTEETGQKEGLFSRFVKLLKRPLRH